MTGRPERVVTPGPLPRGGALLAALATAMLYALAMPPAELWALVPVALVPLLRAFAGQGAGARAALGALSGTVAALLATAVPLAAAVQNYFAVPLAVGAMAAIPVALIFAGGSFAVFGLLIGDLARAHPAAAAVRTGLALAAGEFYRETILTGLPWLALGHALAFTPSLAQLATVGGATFLSAWIAATNAAVLASLMPRTRTAGLVTLAALTGVVAIAALAAPPFGVVRRAGREAPPASARRVALVQPAVSSRRGAGDVERVRRRLARLSRAAGPAWLVVWPENSLASLLPANRDLVDRTRRELGRPQPLLLGAPRYDPSDPARHFNSALLFDGAGALVGTHDKTQLVPIAEYAPAGLSRLRALGAGLSPGPPPHPLSLDGERFGVLLCYEALFPSLAVRHVSAGAGMIFNLSSDGYFGGSAGARQHLAAVVLRAIETRRAILRATTDGLTVAIDPAGRIVARLPPQRPGFLRVDVEPGQGDTPATRAGHLFAPIASLGVVMWSLLDAHRRRRWPRRAAAPPGIGGAA